ncbi:MAG: hypothetical protein LIO87_06675 [Eubacterium sp.]|nr:hypothetical protein [Eubacterium sp.]
MMYPFLTLPDKTEIVHSEMKPNGKVKVYIEKPVYDGFHSAVCYLPEYKWEDIEGFSESEISYLKKLVEKNAHLIMEYSQKGGFANAANF